MVSIRNSSLVVLLIASLTVLSGCWINRGKDTVDEAVQSFVAALEANDSKALAALVHPDFSGEPDVASFLERYGGGKMDGVQIGVEVNTVASFLATAKVEASFTPRGGDTATPIVFELSLRQAESGWFVELGEPRGGRNDPGPPTIPRP